MARNRSEKRPHPEVPERFHERVRLLEIYVHNRSMRNKDSYNDHIGTFSAAEKRSYSHLDLGVVSAMRRYYAMMARQAAYAA